MRPELLVLALTLGTAACATSGAVTGAVPRPFPGAPVPPGSTGTTAEATPVPAEAPPPGPLVAPDRRGPRAIVATALSLRGTPYRDGGTDPAQGFDCSGFIQYVFARHGQTLPREAKDQYTVGKKVKSSKVRPGDLLFFSTVAKGPSHVGLSIGGDQFVHATSERGVVRVERVTDGYWGRRFIGARRPPS